MKKQVCLTFEEEIETLIRFYKLFGVSVRSNTNKMAFYCQYVLTLAVWVISIVSYTRGTHWLIENFQMILNPTFIVLVISIQMSTLPSVLVMTLYLLRSDKIKIVLSNFDEINRLLIKESIKLNYRQYAHFGTVLSIVLTSIFTITELLCVLTSAHRNNLPFYAYDFLFISQTVVIPAAPLIQFAFAAILCKIILVKINTKILALKRSSRNSWMDFSVTDDEFSHKDHAFYQVENFKGTNKISKNLEEKVLFFKKVNQVSNSNHDRLIEFKNLFKIHKKLVALVKNLMNFYGFLISINMFRYATAIIPNLIQVGFADQDIRGDNLILFKLLAAFAAIQRLIFLFWIAFTCESVLEQHQLTKKMIHKMLNQNPEPHLSKQLILASLQLKHQQLRFSAHGLHDICYKQVFSLIVVIIAFMIIQCQLRMAFRAY